jgi:hypothetical protein
MSAHVAPVLTHECPAPACTEHVDPDRLMCSRCWYQVPKPLRKAVWIVWRRSAGAGTPAHRAAMRAAIAAVSRAAPSSPSPTLSHPARGFALVSTPRAGLDSPAMTRRSPTDER